MEREAPVAVDAADVGALGAQELHEPVGVAEARNVQRCVALGVRERGVAAVVQQHLGGRLAGGTEAAGDVQRGQQARLAGGFIFYFILFYF